MLVKLGKLHFKKHCPSNHSVPDIAISTAIYINMLVKLTKWHFNTFCPSNRCIPDIAIPTIINPTDGNIAQAGRYNWACLGPIEIGEISRAVKHIINDCSSLHSRTRVLYFHFAVVKELLFLHIDTQLKGHVNIIIFRKMYTSWSNMARVTHWQILIKHVIYWN